jgi:DNA-binding XRE family transcriptional regulator
LLALLKGGQGMAVAPQTIRKIEKGLHTRKESELKIAKALQKKYWEVFGSYADV